VALVAKSSTPRRQNTPRKPVAVTVQSLLDTPYRNNVGTNPVNHLATATISAFISATGAPSHEHACATMAWPMLSS